MRKNLFGRQFKRDANERKSLFKSLVSALIFEDRIKTTEAKAKAVKSLADRIITHAKKGGIAAEQLLKSYLPQVAIERVVTQIAPRFTKRQGGYTRILRLGRRFSDRAPMVFLEWVDKGEVKSQKSRQSRGSPKAAKVKSLGPKAGVKK